MPQMSPIMWESFILFGILIILVTVIYISSMTMNFYSNKNNKIKTPKFLVGYFW